jgi:hypothetical protein
MPHDTLCALAPSPPMKIDHKYGKGALPRNPTKEPASFIKS